jgi:putative tricarboxylic transport membrane protein
VTRLEQAAGLVLIAFGAFVVYLSLELTYYSDVGPGPGFFSLWLGVVLVLLAAVDLVGATRAPRRPLPAGFLPDRQGTGRLAAIVLALVVAVPLLLPLGFPLTIFVFSVFLLRVVAVQRWWVTLVIAAGAGFGTFWVFRQLQVMLPAGPLPF